MICDFYADVCLSADSESPAEVTLDSDSFPQFAVPGIENRDGDNHEIVSKREPAEHRPSPR